MQAQRHKFRFYQPLRWGALLLLSLFLLVLAGRWLYSELHFYQASKLIAQINLSKAPIAPSAIDLIDSSLNRYQQASLVIRPAFYDYKVSVHLLRLTELNDPSDRDFHLSHIQQWLALQTQSFPDYPFVWVNNLRMVPLLENSDSFDVFWFKGLHLARNNPLVNLELALTINDLWPFLNREQRLEALEIIELGFSRTRRNAQTIHASLTDQHTRRTVCLYLRAKQVINADVCKIN
ncbi:hypothetical protein JX580_05825 [Thiomicrospira microaerophila]|uniref:hypothetical protein n=1 Tax=Thiomicrospira microaerophila TaxID=406020 RepID=UPI00200D508C|nr:hypothetical protein [Thiomicrospira microaerophila]UQB43376.1 hypothetical protein JX580_05825 [Thiomicrospira microaerophila]